MTVEVRVDETLEAVALVLRDLKVDFEEKLSQIASEGGAARESFTSRLTEVVQTVDTVAADAVKDRRELAGHFAELRQRLEAALDRQREEDEGRAAALEVLRKKVNESEKVGQGAVEIARATQESMLRLTEEAQEAMKPLAEGVDDARAQHQTVMTELAELDAKTMLRPEFEDLLRTYVFGDVPEGFRALTLAELHEKMTALEAEASTTVKRFRELHQETQDTFHRVDTECKALADRGEEYREKFTRSLEGLAKKQDLEAVQELLEESAARITDVLDFSQSAADSTDQALQKHRTRMETALEALRDTFSDRQEQLRDQMSEMREAISEDLIAEVQASVAVRSKDSDRMLVQQAEQFIAKLAENIKGERGPAGQVSRVQQWVADYQFPELTLVRHRAGLWQALRDTMAEPGTSGNDWQLIAAGILAMEVAPDETRPGQYRLIVRDSDDRSHEVEFQIPLPTFHKTWDAKHEYRYYDSVMEDGHRWLATKDAPVGPPSRSEDWVLLGMRGGRGARGAKGDPGAAGPAPDIEEILDAYDRRRLEANGTPVFSFRGAWRFGADYVVGDFVRGPGVMALCREAHRAEKPPTGTNPQWEILFGLPDSGPRPQDLQAQITALTAQVQALTGAG